MKCMWCKEGCWCELKAGVADDDSCNGTKKEMCECYWVENNAEYDGISVEDLIKRWGREEEK